MFAREEERKRLRRDLHDELAPTFAGLGLSAAAVEAFARAGDDRAADAAERLVTGLHAATRQLREVAYDLRPPVLDDRGLAAAIRERVAAPGSLPVVEVDAPNGDSCSPLRSSPPPCGSPRRRSRTSGGTPRHPVAP